MPVDPAGLFSVVENRGSTVSAYSIDGAAGALAEIDGSPLSVAPGSYPQSVTVDPAGRFAYVANQVSFPLPGNVSAFAIDGTTGALTPVAGSPFLAGTRPSSVAADPPGPVPSVADFSSTTVSGYTIDGTTGALTEVVGSPFGTGPFPISVTVDPSGQFAYVANDISMPSAGSISAYTIDGTTGALTEVAGSAFPAGVQPVSVTTTAGPQPPPATPARK